MMLNILPDFIFQDTLPHYSGKKKLTLDIQYSYIFIHACGIVNWVQLQASNVVINERGYVVFALRHIPENIGFLL